MQENLQNRHSTPLKPSNQTIWHIPFPGTESFQLSLLAKQYNKLLYICADEREIEAITNNLAFLIPSTQVHILPAWDGMPYDITSPKAQVLLNRVNTLTALANPSSTGIFITSIAGIIQRVPSKQNLLYGQQTLQVKHKYDRQTLLNQLYEYGYQRSPVAVNIGEMAVRGHVIDIINNSEYGIRLDFLGNTLEQIKRFDTQTQLSNGQERNVTLSHLSELIFNKKTLGQFEVNYYKHFHTPNYVISNAILEGRRTAGAEYLLPLFYEQLCTIEEYLQEDAAIVINHNIWDKLDKRLESIQDQYQQRQITSKSLPYPALKPSTLYMDKQEMLDFASKRQAILFTPWSEHKSPFRAAPNLAQVATMKQTSVFEILREYVGREQQILISCFSQGSRERMKEILAKHDLTAVKGDSREEALAIGRGGICLILMNLDKGFATDGEIIFSEQDVLGERLSRSRNAYKANKRFMTEAVSLHPGDIVVHVDHGIGRFAGLSTMDIQGKTRDFIKLLYEDDDVLYVPVENFDLISKYAEELTVSLDKLGSSSWQNRKSRLKQRIKLAAAELIKTAAKRATQQAPILEAIPEMYTKFCERFPYVETEDQMRAIDDVLADLVSGRPTDRLVCGDVGFGKTEVAMRAACAVTLADSPMQVAIVVPTTLLARQHYYSFSERFKGLPVRIAQLSKFVNAKDAKVVKQGMADGSVDIVIGTHALLSKSIVFKRLGLVIVDEEQHFGVAQKEILKKLRNDIHVLTLSATPIPRTLNMSLTGVKELSLIGTPPIDRLPIRTQVLPQFDPVVVRDAILREHSRGGRTFYVTPQISYMPELAAQIMGIAPEVKIIQAHGQMSSSQLDSIMNDFYDGKYDIMLSTAIVESGLDIPAANTIIVDRADHFGLTKLYQIRGRVGRASNQGYAYLIASDKVSEIGTKRLEVMAACDTLGSGFSIASQDMDMRGFGNILGDEQSGHIREVGIELYQDMLQSAIGEMTGHQEYDHDWSPVLNIGLSAQIPESYISDSSTRLVIYRQIARTENQRELQALAMEVIDRFGAPLPEELQALVKIVELKQLAKSRFVYKIERGQKGVVFALRPDAKLAEDVVIRLLERYGNRLKLKPDGKIALLGDYIGDEAFFNDVRCFLDELASA
ncbi:MAG: transcription-repair coupling factor [Proteobacteria bacterium]|nr:transcription-repair coupling factor [Pseudomonadota bacterium]